MSCELGFQMLKFGLELFISAGLAGLTLEQTAAVLGISTATVKRDWAMARAWLYRELTG